jgi:chemotaxis protein histidine kinase CheA
MMRVLFLILTALSFLVACASHPGAKARHAVLIDMASVEVAQVAEGKGAPTSARHEVRPGADTLQPVRVLIRQAAIDVEVGDVAAALVAIRDLALKKGGFVLSSSLDSITVKVPSERLDEVVDTIGALGHVRRRTIEARDVTAEYLDLEARLQNAQATRDQLRALLQKAANVEETLRVQTELSRVQEMIERLQGRLNYLKTRSALSEVRVEVRQKRVPGPVVLLFQGIGWGLGKLFWL